MSGELPGDLACRELVELVTEYLEGALPEEERVAFEQHLVICTGCAAHMDQVHTTRRAVGALAGDRIDPASRARLLDAFRDWSAG